MVWKRDGTLICASPNHINCNHRSQPDEQKIQGMSCTRSWSFHILPNPLLLYVCIIYTQVDAIKTPRRPR